MKTCSGCGETDLTKFGVNKSKQDGLQTQCKECRKTYAKSWYKDNSEAHYQRTRVSLNKLRQDVYDYLKLNPCIDCGESRPECLDFDHTDIVTKTANISELVAKGARKKVFEEIVKCEVRCSNCHRVKTAKQFGWYAFVAR